MHRDLSASVSLVLELKLRASLLSFVLFFLSESLIMKSEGPAGQQLDSEREGE